MKRRTYFDILKLRFPISMLLLLDLAFNLLFIIFLIPAFNYGVEFVMKLMDLSYITIENVYFVLTSPPAIVLILLLLITLPLFLLIKLIAMIYYCNTEGAHKKPFLLRVISFSFLKTLHSIRKGTLGMLLFTLPFYVFTNLPLFIGVTFFSNIELSGGVHDEMFLKGLIILSLILIGFISFRGVFVIHFSMNEHLGFMDSMEHSVALLKGRCRKTLLVLTVYNIGLTLSFFLFYYTVLLITVLAVYLFANKSLAITVFLSVYPKISLYSTIFFSMIAFVINIDLITSLYRTYQEENFQDIFPNDTILEPSFYKYGKNHKHMINSFLLFVIVCGIFNFYWTIRNDSSYLSETISGIQISSHRGNSHVAPENTIPALENAIIANSDYAEIDIQQTKDGVLVLLHDKSLLRTAGLNRFIWNLTNQEINNLDVGSWFGIEFINTKIPTLEDVLIYCKGKIKLNIEIKINGNEQNLENQLVTLIEQYKYEHQCVVSSSNYNTLIKVKMLNDEIRTGYIMSAIYGNIYAANYVDFFSIRSNFVTTNVVDSAHRAGKEVHAWTVNSTREIERMKSMGVDTIITDNPALAKEIIYRDDTNDTFIQLIKKMFKNRTFYRLIQILN